MTYNRRFIILNKFDEKLCREGATGYCKIESKDDKSNLSVFVQGLESFEYGWRYDIFLINALKGQFAAAFIGSVNLEKGSGEFSVQVDSANVSGSGLAITNFDAVIICARNIYKPELSEIPLAGYYDAPLDRNWRNTFLGYLKQEVNQVQEKKEEPTAKIASFSEHKDEPPIQGADFNNTYAGRYLENLNENNYTEYFKHGNIKEINEILNKVKGVQEFNPFEKAKLKYKWWKVTNESFLESIFRFNAASTQIYKHPLIKRMLRQANHCLFGIVSDVDEKVRFIVFGFPSPYSMKDQLYIGGFASFYPSAGYNKRKGDHGYWVVHIKLDDGSIAMTV